MFCVLVATAIQSREFTHELEVIWETDIVRLHPVDVDGDHIDEVLAVGGNSLALADQRLDFHWHIPHPRRLDTLGCNCTSYDVDADGETEVVLSYCLGDSVVVEAWSLNGKLKDVLSFDPRKDSLLDVPWKGFTLPSALADLDGDGLVEAVLDVNSGYRLQPRGVYVYDWKEKREEWYFLMGPWVDSRLADVTGDGRPEVVVQTYAPGNGAEANGTVDTAAYVACLSPEGDLLWLRKVFTGKFCHSEIDFLDVDQDGAQEIAVASRQHHPSLEPDTVLILRGGDGRVLRKRRVGEFVRELRTADLNNDGAKEIVTSNSDGYLRVLNGELEQIAEQYIGSDPCIIATSDLDGNGVTELVANTSDGNIVICNNKLVPIASRRFTGGRPAFASLVSHRKSRRLLVTTAEQRPREGLERYVLLELRRTGLRPVALPVMLIGGLVAAVVILAAATTWLSIGLTNQRRSRKAVLEQAVNGQLVIGPGGVVTEMNEAAAELLGTRLHETIGVRYDSRFGAKGLEPLREFIAQALRVPSARDKAGARPASHGAELNIDRDGKAMKVEAKAARTPMGLVVSLEDITEREYAKRVLAWAPMAQELAHGIKNPLTTVKLRAELLGKEVADQAAQGHITAIKKEADRLRDMTDGFMRFSERKPPKLQSLCINSLLHEVVDGFKAARAVKFVLGLPDGLPKVMVDPERMREALASVVENSVAAMPDGGSLTVTTSRVERFENRAARTMVRIEVLDTGKGIPKAYLDKVFKPFFTRKEGGTGLGLAIVRKTIEEHGGYIEIQSEEGVGTAVTIDLPTSA